MGRERSGTDQLVLGRRGLSTCAAPLIRSRLAVRELKAKIPELMTAELFSAMPLLEALRLEIEEAHSACAGSGFSKSDC